MNLAIFRVMALFFLAFSLLFIDFITKAACYYLLPPASLGFEGIVVFKNFLGVDFLIQLVLNKGAAWGLFAHFQIPLLILRIALILGMLYYLLFKEHAKHLEWPMMLICTGAIGNVIDFFLYGSVVDFLHFNLWGYHFPLFNVADVCITVGVAWLMLMTLVKQKPVFSS